MDGISPIDALALQNGGMNNNGNGWGGDFFLLILFLFLFNGNGFGQNGFGGAATAAAQNEILSGQQFDRVYQKQDAIAQGICDSTYALNNSITGEGRAMQTQLANCCCNIESAIHAEGDATRALIRENEIQTLRDKVTDLQMQTSQCRQNEYLVSTLRPCPIPSYLTCSPYQAYSPCGFGGNYQPNI